MFEPIIAAYRQAADAARHCPLRRGQVVHTPPGADLLIAGDLHGNGQNLLRIERLADLDRYPERHVVLQELIHPTSDASDPPAAAGDDSHHVLTRVARWQARHPQRVHVILGNHELAQMTGQDILKDGASICRAFADGVAAHYGGEAAEVLDAMYDYCRALPLAVRSADGVAVVHSLPADRLAPRFDATIFVREQTDADRLRSGPVYQLVWGRTVGRAAIDLIRQILDAKLLVLGHQPQPTGFRVLDHDALIIASEHRQGVALPLPPGPPPSADDLAERLIRLGEVAF
ncbi:MAG: hypothetical protein BIFFINMI_00486 [Phycisphaerae bacterium]|nr:hypothetical protein [Phycisphaerae bacterium]